MSSLSARLLECIESGCRMREEEARQLLELASINKLRLSFLRRFKHFFPNEYWVEEERFSRFLRAVEEVTRILNGLNYALYKFLRPVDHASVDINILVDMRQVGLAVKRLREQGYRVKVIEHYTVTTVKRDAIVDLCTHPSFTWIVYIDGQQLLREHSMDIVFHGIPIRSLTRDAEVAVTTAHAVYKEHMVLFLDCLVVDKWLSKRALDIAQEIDCVESLETVVSICNDIKKGFIEAPYRIPMETLTRIYLAKTIRDSAFRATLLNPLKRLLKDRRIGTLIAWRLTRRSY